MGSGGSRVIEDGRGGGVPHDDNDNDIAALGLKTRVLAFKKARLSVMRHCLSRGSGICSQGSAAVQETEAMHEQWLCSVCKVST